MSHLKYFNVMISTLVVPFSHKQNCYINCVIFKWLTELCLLSSSFTSRSLCINTSTHTGENIEYVQPTLNQCPYDLYFFVIRQLARVDLRIGLMGWCIWIKLWRSGVPTRGSSSRRISKLCNLSRVDSD